MDQPTTARQNAIASIVERHSNDHTQRVDFKQTPARQLFGVNVVSAGVMRARLPEDVHKALKNTLRNGAPPDPSIAGAVARVRREWAMGKGGTPCTRWSQPLTGLSAEKHDSCLTPTEAGT